MSVRLAPYMYCLRLQIAPVWHITELEQRLPTNARTRVWRAAMRLLPRLLPALRKSRIEGPDWPTFIPPDPLGRRKRRSLYRPPEPAPVDAPPPVFASHGRVRSVLLDTPNAVASRARHKRTPPWARIAYNQRRPQKQSEDSNGEWDPARLMSDKERGWWSSPYRECR
jgi:hypothetical protein